MSVKQHPSARRAEVRGSSADTAGRFRPPFPIFEAKLQPPIPPSGTVERERLLETLADPGRSVVSMIAPPGYGKTTLLAQWAAREERPLAWLTLDALDNDPAVLVTYLATSFDRVVPIDPSIRSSLGGSGGRVLARAIPRLLAELHNWPQSGVLIVDDVHQLTDRHCLDALIALLDYLPRGFRVAIAGRAEPDLPFARLRAQRRLLEIGPAHLALDEMEAAALVAAAGYRLNPDQVRALTARTEGWATGIYLSLLAPEGRTSGLGGIDVSGDEPQIAAYFRSEFEHDMADGDLAFLTRSAVLDRITPPAVAAVTGDPDAADRLDSLSRRNLLIQRTRASDTTYRYHTLLRDFLVAELERREPGSSSVLHQRAATWYRTVGEMELAIEHAIASGDLDLTAEYVTAVAVPTHHRGHTATINRWLEAFDTQTYRRNPPLAVIAAWVYLLTGQPEEAGQLADIADAASYAGPTPDGAASFVSQRAMLRAVMARNGPRDVLDNAQFAAAAEPADSPWRASALQLLGGAYRLVGKAQLAEDAYGGAVDAGASSGVTAMVALAQRAAIRIRRSDWEAASDFLEQARVLLDEGNYRDIIPTLIVHAVGARIAINRGDLERGREDLVAAQLIRPMANYAIPWFSVDALLELSRAYLAAADPAGAQMVLREAEHIVRRRPALGTLIGELLDMRRRLAGATTTLVGSSALTTAELRVLPLLPTYLSFQEIADRLMISRNTVKTHAMSIYGKLWASSRSEAVERAVELGLLEPFPVLASTNGHAPPSESVPVE